MKKNIRVTEPSAEMQMIDAQVKKVDYTPEGIEIEAVVAKIARIPPKNVTKDDAADATFGGCFLLLIFGLISWAVGLVFYAVSMVVALGRSVQLYVYAAFSPIPISLLGFEETKQIGIGYLKNFAAAALAGVVMVLILYLYPHLVTALAVSGGLGKAEMLGLAQGVETFDSFGVIIKTIAVLITTMMGLVKSGSWAKEILGA